MKLNVEIHHQITYASNDDLCLFGGLQSGNSKPGETRRKYIILDVKRFDSLVDQGMDVDTAHKSSQVGFVDLFIKNGTVFDVVGLGNIEITNKKEHRERRAGYGTNVVKSIIETIETDLQIYDIQRGSALKFWKSLGTEFKNSQWIPVEITHQGTLYGTVKKDIALELDKPIVQSLPEEQVKKRKGKEIGLEP